MCIDTSCHLYHDASFLTFASVKTIYLYILTSGCAILLLFRKWPIIGPISPDFSSQFLERVLSSLLLEYDASQHHRDPRKNRTWNNLTNQSGLKRFHNDKFNSHNLTNLCPLILKQPLISIMDQIDPPSANISVRFNAFEMLCSPQCITDMSRVYFLSVNIRKSCKYVHLAVGSGRVTQEQRALNRPSVIE